MILFRFRTAMLGLLAFALLCAGCGMEDYDSKTRAEQKRTEQLKKEFEELDPPLTIPKANPEKEPEIEVYLRPPRFKEPKPNPNQPVQPSPTPDPNNPDGLVRAGPFLWKMNGDYTQPVKGIGIAIADKSSQPLDAGELLKSLTNASLEPRKETINPPAGSGRQPIVVDKWVFEVDNPQTKTRFKYVLCVDAKRLVGVVYQASSDPKKEVQTAVEAQIKRSLETLVVGRDEASKAEVTQLRAEYLQRAKGGRR